MAGISQEIHGAGKKRNYPMWMWGTQDADQKQFSTGGVQCIPPKQVHIFRPVQLHFFTHLQNTVLLLQKRECSPDSPLSFTALPTTGWSFPTLQVPWLQHKKKPQRTCYYGTEQAGTPFSPPPLYKNISLKQQHAPSPFCNLNARNFNSLQPSEGKLTQGLLRPYPMSREGKGNGRSSCMKHGCARQHMQNWAMAHPRPWCQAQCRPSCSVNTEWFHGPSCRSCSSVRLDLTATAQPTLHQISSWKPIIFLPHSKRTHLIFFSSKENTHLMYILVFNKICCHRELNLLLVSCCQ